MSRLNMKPSTRVKKLLNRRIEGIFRRMDKMEDDHDAKLKEARLWVYGGTRSPSVDSSLAHWFKDSLEACRYLRECPVGPSEEGRWYNMPVRDFQRFNQLGRDAAVLTRTRDEVVAALQQSEEHTR